MQTYSTVRSIDSRSYVQPKIVSTKLFSTKCCVSYMLSLLGRSALERHFLGVPTAWIFTETPLIKFDMIWRLRLKHSLSASNFKAKIALVYKWKALSCTYVKKCSDWITYMYISDRVFIAHKWQIMHAFLSSIFFQNNLEFFRNTIKVSNSLDPDQARHLVVSDLGPTYLQRLSASDTS